MKNLIYKVQPGGQLKGQIRVPGDKSISHRAVMLGALADGITTIDGFLTGEDCVATLRAFQQMGVKVEGPHRNKVVVHGVGMHGLKSPQQTLDLGNSGTSMRLLTGMLAAQNFDSVLTGDSSLRKRPMLRIAEPLMQMGAKIKLQPQGTPPIEIFGSQNLHGIDYQMSVASAQVKSGLLLAALYAKGENIIKEPTPTRDHTERMLETFGYPVQRKNATVNIKGGGKLTAAKIVVPGDISSAAFFIVGASIAPNSDLLIKNVGINPTRIGILNILKLMGADITLENKTLLGAEPVADIHIKYKKLTGISIPLDQVPLAIDEFPAILIAAACAQGVTTLRGAAELRVKESDRIQAMADGLKILGIQVKTFPDGIEITGGEIQGGKIQALGDHRIAMAFAMSALAAKSEVIIEDCANVATSFPGFVELARQTGLNIELEEL